jgi:predicted nuclease of predicted toxin-antitoxin system
MKFKLDENLPQQIAIDLRTSAQDVQTVGEEGLTGGTDTDVWQGEAVEEPTGESERVQ